MSRLLVGAPEADTRQPGVHKVHFTLLFSALLFFTLLYSTLYCSNLVYSAFLYFTLLYSTLLYFTLLYSSLLFFTLLYTYFILLYSTSHPHFCGHAKPNHLQDPSFHFRLSSVHLSPREELCTNALPPSPVSARSFPSTQRVREGRGDDSACLSDCLTV